MAYTIQYIDKKGSHHTDMTSNPLMVKTKIVRLFKQRIEAVAFQKGGETVGRVWKDNSQRRGWNYFIDNNIVNPD